LYPNKKLKNKSKKNGNVNIIAEINLSLQRILPSFLTIMASEPEKTSKPENEIVNLEVSIHKKRYINCTSENYNEIVINIIK